MHDDRSEVPEQLEAAPQTRATPVRDEPPTLRIVPPGTSDGSEQNRVAAEVPTPGWPAVAPRLRDRSRRRRCIPWRTRSGIRSARAQRSNVSHASCVTSGPIPSPAKTATLARLHPRCSSSQGPSPRIRLYCRRSMLELVTGVDVRQSAGHDDVGVHALARRRMLLVAQQARHFTLRLGFPPVIALTRSLQRRLLPEIWAMTL